MKNLTASTLTRLRIAFLCASSGLMRGAVSVALVYLYFDDDPRQMPDKGRATLIVSTLMVSGHAPVKTSAT